MLARVNTFAIDGLDARPVWAEVDVRPGLPAFGIVGLADAATSEARERVRGALLRTDFAFPTNRITANVAPSHLRKVGPGFDLALAVGILAATQQCSPERLADFAVYGELTLSGGLRPCRGTLAAAQAAQRAGLRGLIVPRSCALEAAAVEGLQVAAVDDLPAVVRVLAGAVRPLPPAARDAQADNAVELPDVVDVRGQQRAVRALEIAAVGGHHLLLLGARGTGLAALARRLPGLLPPLPRDEALEVTRIHSIAGLHDGGGLVTTRPFRAPHHSISPIGLLGGGHPITPGEATLSHRGVLLLDQLDAFPRLTVQALRSAAYDGEVIVSRGSEAATLPTRFLLVATAPLCPGGCRANRCHCPRTKRKRFHRRMFPRREAFEMRVRVDPPDVSASPGPTTSEIRDRVIAAREILRRYPSPHAPLVAHRTGTPESLATRRVLHVAKSIAALDGRDRPTRQDIEDASSYAPAT